MNGFERSWAAVAAIVILFSSGAAGQMFGTKVALGDPDSNRPLDNFACKFTPWIGWWDIGPNPLIFDEGDVLYLHFGLTAGGPPFNTIKTNDIRLTPWEDKPAGSKVKPNDNDIGQPLVLPHWVIVCFMDLFGTTLGYDIKDPVYLKFAPPLGAPIIGTNDLRLTTFNIKSWLQAGEKVKDFDDDHNKPLAFPPMLTGNPIGLVPATATLRFYNANGNYLPGVGGIPIYDDPDDVYIDMPNLPAISRGIVTVNDLRLTEPTY